MKLLSGIDNLLLVQLRSAPTVAYAIDLKRMKSYNLLNRRLSLTLKISKKISDNGIVDCNNFHYRVPRNCI